MKRRIFIILFFFISVGESQESFYHPELEWRTIETDHFYVHYHRGAERTARLVAKIAEEIYEPITSLYNHIPDGKVSFIIKDYDDYSNGAAYFFDNKVEIWASSMDFDLRGTHNWLRNVITHEFTHIVQIQTTFKFGRRIPGIYFQWLGYEAERRPDVLYGYPNVIVSYPLSGFVIPSWFAEGVAQYNRKELGYDSWDTHRDMLLRMYAIDNNMLSWNEMAVFGKTSLGNEASYNAGFAFVRYIAQKYGDDKLAEISCNLSKITALTIDGAIEKAAGKSGGALYDEWKEFLRKDYDARTFSFKNNIVNGAIVADIGFANFYPTFSPDGSKLAYVSNKEADYFGLSSIYLYDCNTKTEKLLQPGVRSNLTWSIDGKKIYYAKHSRDNAHWSNFMDLYVYDLGEEKETRLTHSLRANAPSMSPDGKTLVFVAGSDGTLNLFTLNLDDSNVHQLTRFTNGEQIYNPKWSPDGKNIVFDYSIKDGRDIALLSIESGDVEFILASPHDERNAIFTHDGSKIIYSSDKSGIFNLYQYDFGAKEFSQLTNVLGGVFMPSMTGNHQLAFSSYTSDGYKIAILDNPQPLTNPSAYVKQEEPSFVSAERLSSDNGAMTQQKDWQTLRSYDDSQHPQYEDTPYKNTTTSLTLVPFLRVDNYNPRNKGIDVIKLGLYGFSYDVLEHYGFFAGAAINKTGERDLFFTFDYRGNLPGLGSLGLEPSLSLDVYNITRKTESQISLPQDTIPVGISYNLIQFDVAMKQKFLSEVSEIELRYSHSRYNASIGSFLLPPPSNALIPAFSSLYLVGNDISATWHYEKNGQSRTQEINPVGRKIRLRYDYEFHRFNPTSDYEISNGLLVPKYQKPTFHRLELSWREQNKLPGWKHTLSAHLRSGSILGPPVDNFFDFYIGGLAGMKGYPFYSLGGNEYLLTNLTYRFPVWENIDLRFLHLYFDKLYGAIYGDVGTTWTEGGVRGQKFKRDAGVELRLEAFSFYSYPTRIFFNATYGFDQFTRTVSDTQLLVTYGKEWSYHFGVLFGFEFD